MSRYFRIFVFKMCLEFLMLVPSCVFKAVTNRHVVLACLTLSLEDQSVNPHENSDTIKRFLVFIMFATTCEFG